jgi:hypothetical protein
MFRRGRDAHKSRAGRSAERLSEPRAHIDADGDPVVHLLGIPRTIAIG